MDTIEQTNYHPYFTRSKAKQIRLTESVDKNKKTLPKKSKRIYKIDHYDEDELDIQHHKQKSKPITLEFDEKNTPSKEELSILLLDGLIDKIMGKMDEDSDYEPIEGLPEDIIYTEEEEEYVRNLDLCNRESIINIEKELLEEYKSEVPYRFKILNSNLPLPVKNHIIKRLDHFYSLEETDNEYHKLFQWVSYLNKIPFDVYTEPIVTIEDTSSNIVKHLFDIKHSLDNL